MNLILFVRDIHDKLIKHRYVHVYVNHALHNLIPERATQLACMWIFRRWYNRPSLLRPR